MWFLKHILIPVLLAAPTFVCRADTAPENLKPTRTISKAPVEVRRLTPRTAKTLQLSVFKIGENRSDVLLHLYTDSGDQSPSAHLDVFAWRNRRFTRIHSFKLQRPAVYRVPPAPPVASELAPFAIYGVQWLDVRKQAQPIIAVATPNFRGFEEGKIRLFIFNNGVKQKPTQQDFDYFSGLGADRLLYFDSVDKAGKVRLLDYYSRTGGGPDFVEEERKLYEWNGKRFIPVK